MKWPERRLRDDHCSCVCPPPGARLLRWPGDVTAAGSARHVQDGVGVRSSPGQHADRLCCGQDDQVDLAAAGLVPDLLHDRQGAVGASTDHQPAASPRDVLLGGERGVPVRAAKLPGGGLLALADLPVVDDQVVVLGHAVDPDRSEAVAGELHADAPCPAPGSYGRYRQRVQTRMRSVSVPTTASQAIGQAPVRLAVSLGLIVSPTVSGQLLQQGGQVGEGVQQVVGGAGGGVVRAREVFAGLD